MEWSESTRRSFLKQFGAAGAAALAATKAEGWEWARKHPPPSRRLRPLTRSRFATREARMAWWHEAKFGMFIHWGLYSVIGQHEWAMERREFRFRNTNSGQALHPKPNAARDWARLAKRAGQKYMVMTTKHHEGFCNFDTKLTDYAP